MNDADCPAFLNLYRSAGPCEAGWVLDLGAGRARWLPTESGARWLSFDLRFRPLQQAVGTASTEGRAFHQGDAHRLPYRDNAFAGVVSNALLHHVTRPEQVLAESVRVLAPGGLVLFRDLLPGDEARSPAPGEWPCRLLQAAEVAEHVARLGFPAAGVQRRGKHWVWLARRQPSADSAV